MEFHNNFLHDIQGTLSPLVEESQAHNGAASDEEEEDEEEDIPEEFQPLTPAQQQRAIKVGGLRSGRGVFLRKIFFGDCFVLLVLNNSIKTYLLLFFLVVYRCDLSA